MPNEILDQQDQLRRMEVLAEAMAKGHGYMLMINDGTHTQQIIHATGQEMVEMFATAMDNDPTVALAITTAQAMLSAKGLHNQGAEGDAN